MIFRPPKIPKPPPPPLPSDVYVTADMGRPPLRRAGTRFVAELTPPRSPTWWDAYAPIIVPFVAGACVFFIIAAVWWVGRGVFGWP